MGTGAVNCVLTQARTVKTLAMVNYTGELRLDSSLTVRGGRFEFFSGTIKLNDAALFIQSGATPSNWSAGKFVAGDGATSDTKILVSYGSTFQINGGAKELGVDLYVGDATTGAGRVSVWGLDNHLALTGVANGIWVRPNGTVEFDQVIAAGAAENKGGIVHGVGHNTAAGIVNQGHIRRGDFLSESVFGTMWVTVPVSNYNGGVLTVQSGTLFLRGEDGLYGKSLFQTGANSETRIYVGATLRTLNGTRSIGTGGIWFNYNPLVGSSTIDGDVSIDGGTLRISDDVPGEVGPVYLNGNLTLGSDATFALTWNGTTMAADRLVIDSGRTVQLGGTLSVTLYGSQPTRDVWVTVIEMEAPGTMEGDFSSIVMGATPLEGRKHTDPVTGKLLYQIRLHVEIEPGD